MQSFIDHSGIIRMDTKYFFNFTKIQPERYQSLVGRYPAPETAPIRKRTNRSFFANHKAVSLQSPYSAHRILETGPKAAINQGTNNLPRHWPLKSFLFGGGNKLLVCAAAFPIEPSKAFLGWCSSPHQLHKFN